MFIMMLYDCRRGQEGIEHIKKDAYKKKHNSVVGLDFWCKARGELSKNHRLDTEDLNDSGIIHFFEVGIK